VTPSAVNMSAPAPASGAPSLSARLRGTFVPRLVTGLVLLLIWEVAVRLLAPPYVAKPSTVLAVAPRVLTDPKFLAATGSTLLAVAEGLILSLVIGTAIGLAIGRSRIAEKALRQHVNFLYAMPMIVALPLFSLWFGYTGATRTATVVFASIFAIIINAADGARSVPREYLEVARSFRSTSWRVFPEIILPSSLPYLLAGFRLAAGRALIGAVVAEFFISVGGIGHYILYNSRAYRHDDAFVGVLLLAAFGVGFEVLVGWITRRYMPWYRRDEAAV
jgi:NitT/TauT family transport system permease protein